jgi:hypothetical protein
VFNFYREEAQTKMILIRDKEDKDKQQHYTELKEVIRVINHDKKLKEFMKIKTQERAEDEELLNYRKKKVKTYGLNYFPKINKAFQFPLFLTFRYRKY